MKSKNLFENTGAKISKTTLLYYPEKNNIFRFSQYTVLLVVKFFVTFFNKENMKKTFFAVT
jgi:hypothetical protein